jgi:hypothetical protein
MVHSRSIYNFLRITSVPLWIVSRHNTILSVEIIYKHYNLCKFLIKISKKAWQIEQQLFWCKHFNMIWQRIKKISDWIPTPPSTKIKKFNITVYIKMFFAPPIFSVHAASLKIPGNVLCLMIVTEYQHPRLRKIPYVRLPSPPYILDRTNTRVLGHATIYVAIEYLAYCMPDITGRKSPSIIGTDNCLGLSRGTGKTGTSKTEANCP